MLSLFTLVLIFIRFYDVCVHKSAVEKYHNVSGFSVLPTMDSKARAMCHYIAHGRVEKSSWYRPLTQPDEELDVAEYVKECRAPTQSQNVPLVEDGPTPESEGEEIIGDHNQDDILLGSEGERSTETSVDSIEDNEDIVEKLTNVLE